MDHLPENQVLQVVHPPVHQDLQADQRVTIKDIREIILQDLMRTRDVVRDRKVQDNGADQVHKDVQAVNQADHSQVNMAAANTDKAEEANMARAVASTDKVAAANMVNKVE